MLYKVDIKNVAFRFIISNSISNYCCNSYIISAPVETSKNPLDEKETALYRKRTMIILAIEVILFFLSLLFLERWISKTISLGIISEYLLVVLGVLNNVGILKKK